VAQWAKPKCQVSLADHQLEGKEEEERPQGPRVIKGTSPYAPFPNKKHNTVKLKRKHLIKN